MGVGFIHIHYSLTIGEEVEMTNMQSTSTSSGSFFQTWVDALTKPREQTYAAIAASPKAKATTGYIWILVSSIVTSIVTFVAQGAQIQQQLQSSGVDLGQAGGGLGSLAVTILCGAPIAAIVGVLFFAIWVAIVQWIARMFGGKGTNDQLAYTLAAIAAPYSLISAIFVLFALIPYVGFCFNAILGLGGLYILVLQIMALKAVNRFGWGPAIASYAIPGLAVLLVCCVATAIVVTLSGAVLGDVFSTINQSLMQ